MSGRLVKVLAVVALIAVIGLAPGRGGSAAPVGGFSFNQTWQRTDRPVLSGAAARGWVWGPEALTDVLNEPSDAAAGAARQVQYFDKGRIQQESTEPTALVVGGTLPVELLTGQLVTGPGTFEQRAPLDVSVAGGAADPTGPTYADFALVRYHEPIPSGWLISKRIGRGGGAWDDPAVAAYGVTTAMIAGWDGTNHTIAQPFWDFIVGSGPIWAGFETVDGGLFPHAWAIFGLPLTEPYWATVEVDGHPSDVLIQIFERRALTYFPGYEGGWKVQSANVGQHYYEWRYGATPQPSVPSFGEGGPDMGALEAQLRPMVESWGGWNAVSVTDLQTGRSISINGDRPQFAACTIKIFILVAVAQDIEAGRYSRESVYDLVLMAMGPSDTWPARELLRIVGGGDIGAGVHRVNELMWGMGATNSIMTHPPDFAGEEYGYADRYGISDNLLTTNDLNLMLGKIWRGEVAGLGAVGRDYLLWSMTIAGPFHNASLGGPLPWEGVTFYHKIGLIYAPTETWNDAGIVVFNRNGQQYAYAISHLSSFSDGGWLTGHSNGYAAASVVWEAFSR